MSTPKRPSDMGPPFGRNGARSPNSSFGGKSPPKVDSLKLTSSLHAMNLNNGSPIDLQQQQQYLDRFDKLAQTTVGSNSSPKVLNRRTKSPKKVR